ncbi:hypothetical protein KXS07_11250 [Inquilinus limosus]|uniref:hypothetical protein n=1 Tax=Inquilinus limosus TaxID=171674 RepID=UPI00041280CE|nr:hypothetical protein [Inquilinus limosus]
MGRFCRIAVLAVLAAGSAAAAWAQALPDSVEIQNRRSGTIEDLRVSPDFESSWGYNRLRAAPLAPGASARIPTDDLRGGCYFDVKVRQNDGAEAEYWSLNLCSRPVIDLE